MVLDALPYLKWLDMGGYEKSMEKTKNWIIKLEDG